jgi:hypothetical protein
MRHASRLFRGQHEHVEPVHVAPTATSLRGGKVERIEICRRDAEA